MRDEFRWRNVWGDTPLVDLWLESESCPSVSRVVEGMEMRLKKIHGLFLRLRRSRCMLALDLSALSMS